MISLSNGDLLPSETRVTIIARRGGNTLIPVNEPYELPIDSYLIERAGDENFQYWRNEIHEIEKIISRRETELRDQLRAVAETAAQEELSHNESSGNEAAIGDDESDKSPSETEAVSPDSSVVGAQELSGGNDSSRDERINDDKSDSEAEEESADASVVLVEQDTKYFRNVPTSNLSQPGRTPPFISNESSSERRFNTSLSRNLFDGNSMHAFGVSPSPLQMFPFAFTNNGSYNFSMDGMAASNSMVLDLDDRKKETSRGRRTEAKKRKKAEYVCCSPSCCRCVLCFVRLS
jgi:hypothetical protein